MQVYLLVTLDTKGSEASFVREQLQQSGVAVTVVDTGCLGEATCDAEISRSDVFAAAGTTLTAMQTAADRGAAITNAAAGAREVVRRAYAAGRLAGVMALGGSAGTTIGTSAMQVLPLGVPKLMVSTMGSGQVRQYVADKDILMLNSVVDIAGINRISRPILANAAAAMAGMVQQPPLPAGGTDKQLIAATMFGVTTPCVAHAREVLEDAGYEVLVFHATGNGGQAMESLIREGLIAGVLDLTTTELADELVGGVLSAGPDRLTAAAACGVPQVVSVGATDMVNFGPPESVPAQFRERQFYHHNPTVTLMRTTRDENRVLGEQIGARVGQSSGPAAILLPRNGVSAIDQEGQPFHDPEARAALFSGVRDTHGSVPLLELDLHINDAAFAEAAAARLLELMTTKTRQ